MVEYYFKDNRLLVKPISRNQAHMAFGHVHLVS